MYSYTFTRNQMAVGSTSAVIMLMTIAAIMSMAAIVCALPLVLPLVYFMMKRLSR